MLARQPILIVIIAVTAALGATGCEDTSARSAHAPRVALPTPQTSRKAPASATIHHARPAPPEGPRELFLSTYHRPDEGISFRYPRNYSLEEGNPEEHSFFLKRQEELDLEQPGASLLATVVIPEDAYPNTTFEHGSLQLITNETETEQACRETGLLGPTPAQTGSITVQGIVFRGAQEETETAGTKVVERVYAGFSSGRCYQFLLSVAAEEAVDPDGFPKPADTAKILKHLQKIITSAQIFAKSALPPSENQPETQ